MWQLEKLNCRCSDWKRQETQDLVGGGGYTGLLEGSVSHANAIIMAGGGGGGPGTHVVDMVVPEGELQFMMRLWKIYWVVRAGGGGGGGSAVARWVHQMLVHGGLDIWWR